MNQTSLQARIVFPDPFDPKGLEFELPERCSVTIIMVDGNGTEIRRIADAVDFDSGTHNIGLDTMGLAAGTYFCRISADGSTQQYLDIKKLIVR